MPRTVLIIDDDTAFLRLLHMELPKYGFQGVSLTDTCAILDVLKDGQVNMVITDMRMPLMDGYDVVSAVRELHPELPILLTTAHAVNERVKKALRFESVELLCKPFEDVEFQEALYSLFPGLAISSKSVA